MKLILKRDDCTEAGQFSTLIDPTAAGFILQTCERAYNVNGRWSPKIPPGIYKCLRGVHRLDDGVMFVTYEVMGVAGHIGLLFHTGNTFKDSKGCVLTGLARGVVDDLPAVTQSRAAFSQFMGHTAGLPSFDLEVVDS